MSNHIKTIATVRPAVIYSKEPLPREKYLPWWTVYKSWKYLDRINGTLEKWEYLIFFGVREELKIKENLYVPLCPITAINNPLDKNIDLTKYRYIIPPSLGGFLNRKTGLYHYPENRAVLNDISLIKTRKNFMFDAFNLVNRCHVAGYLDLTLRDKFVLDDFNKEFTEELRSLIGVK